VPLIQYIAYMPFFGRTLAKPRFRLGKKKTTRRWPIVEPNLRLEFFLEAGDPLADPFRALLDKSTNLHGV